MAATVALEPTHSPAQNTKVEELAEAMENLALGISAKSRDGNSDMVHDFLTAARADVRAKLQAFLVPALNLIEGGPRQGEQEDVAEDSRVKCRECQRHSICADLRCPHWHKAIQGAIAHSVGHDADEEDGPEVA